MKIDIKDVITLDGKDLYIVISKLRFNENDYLYLINKNDNSKIMFCYIKNNKLIKITDSNLINALIPKFLSEIYKN